MRSKAVGRTMSQSGRVVIPVIFGLALGVAIVLTMRSGRGEADREEAAVVDAKPGVTGLPMALPDGISPEDVQVIELPLPPELEGDAADDEVEVVLATGSLAVRVVWGDDGTPAAGVGIDGRSAVLPQHVPLRRATTDAEGWARLDDLPTGDMTVRGDRGGEVSVGIVADETVEVTLELPVGPWVHGVVLDPDGNTVAGADIWLSAAMTTRIGRVVAQSARDGTFSLRSVGAWHFLAARGASWGPSGLARVPDTEASRVDLTLRMTRGGGDVTVRIETADGVPIPGADVLLGGDDGWTLEPPEFSTGFSRTVPPRRGMTDEDGVVHFMGTPSGESELLVRAPGHAPLGVNEVVNAGEVTRIVVTPHAASGLSGRVLAISDGTEEWVGVSGALVTATHWNLNMRPTDFLATVVMSGEDGAWVMDELAHGDQVKLTATHDVYGKVTSRESLAAGRMREGIDLELTRGLEIRGKVVDENGAPLAGWTVLARTLSKMGHTVVTSAETDASGGFAIPNCPSTSHTVLVREPRPISFATVLRTEDVLPGQTPVTFVVHSSAMSSAEIVFALVDPAGLPVSGAGVSVSSTDRLTTSRVIETAVPGGYHTELLPPGEYELRVWPGRYPMLVRDKLTLDAFERLDLGVLSLGGGGRIAVKLSLPPGLDDTYTWVSVNPIEGGWQGNILQTPDGWMSDLLDPGTYFVSARGQGVAGEYRNVVVRSGETTELSIEMEAGVLCSFEVHGLSGSATVAGHEERVFGGRFLVFEVDHADGSPATRQLESMERAIADDTQKLIGVHLRPGRYTVRVIVGDTQIARSEITVVEGRDSRTVTRLDVDR